MKLTSLQALFLGLVVVLAAPQPGQAQAGPDGGAASANSQAQSDTGSGNKAHDDNFVIGNDDVLAISVWKVT